MIPSTGLPALDGVLMGLQPGDNVVWRVDSIQEYIPFAGAVCRDGLARGAKVVYFRFARHQPVVPDLSGILVRAIHPEAGFEAFIVEIHRIIHDIGRGGYFIFDSMSDLGDNLYSDRMIGNFFKLTCPYLYRLETIAYFSIYRYYHSYHASSPIAETTQVLVDVYNHKGKIFIKPWKVQDRHSSTIFMLHEWEQETFRPVRESAVISEVLSSSPWPGLPSASYRMVGIWDKMFMHADEVLAGLDTGEYTAAEAGAIFHQLLSFIISRDDVVLSLAERYFTLEDIVHIWKRMIGTGLIGGKSTGMLLARAILKKADSHWADVLEEHDSFFIGSDVFYTFLVENDLWMEKQKQKDPAEFLHRVEEVKEKMLRGKFPDYIVTRFGDMLDYFGQSPIIVRSSSLLEDNFGNAFAGKYESVFCANQGARKERLKNFLDAVRVVYASTMSVDALSYRKNRGVLDRDEQMALLVQRVSGQPCGKYFFPHLAGVAYSFNSYAWNKQIDPEAGMMRLVFGLGTRAVDRADDDYTRVVALNAPEKRPEANFDQVRRYAQRRVDVLDLSSDRFSNVYFSDALTGGTDLPVDLFAVRDRTLGEYGNGGRAEEALVWILTFDKVLAKTGFIADMRRMLAAVRDAYGCHVDIEFTTNFFAPDAYRINLLQCRPFRIQQAIAVALPRSKVKEKDVILRAHGAVIGTTRSVPIALLVYVVPSRYGILPEQQRYEVARTIGKLLGRIEERAGNVMLIGPGRWGTSTPSLGSPVTFSEIRTASVLCEIDAMHEGLVPDLSLGTHFFNEMVEMNMLYIAYFVAQRENIFREQMVLDAPNLFEGILPDAAVWSDTIRVVERVSPGAEPGFRLDANTLEQTATLYRE